MAGVKSMLNKFEQVDNNMSAGRGTRPSVAAKPVFQRFQQAAKENTTNDSSTSSSSSSPLVKAGHPPAVLLPGMKGGIPALKPTTPNRGNSHGDRVGGGRLSLPKAFQNGQHDASCDDNDNNNINNNNNNSLGDQTKLKNDTSWQKSKPPSSSNDNRPPVVPKFPAMRSSNQTLTNDTSNSASSFSSTTDNAIDKVLEKTNSKVALLPKHLLNKTDSVRSNSSTSSSISSSSSSSSSSYKTPNASSSTSPTPISPPSSSSSQSQTSGVFDFKSQLRKVDSSSSGPPIKRVLSGMSNDSSSTSSSETQAPTPPPKAPVSTTSSNASTTSSLIGERSKTQSRVPPIPTSHPVESRPKSDESTRDDDDSIVVRKSDGKRFKRIPLPSHKPPNLPKKPNLPTNIDLTSIRQQYQKRKTGSDAVSNEEPVADEDGDIYWDGETTNDSVAPLRPPKPVAQASRESNRISLIPEMTAEEEEADFDLPVYDDTPIEEDIYDDAMSERPEPKPKTSVSSESTETEQEKKKRLKEEANAKKKEEKERREKEKKEREEEKKRKKKEEEENKLKKKFNLTGDEKAVGEGVIKQDAKASGLNLKVTKGQIVTIIRLDSNPPNKWLVKIDTQLGYVDSQNIEVDPNIIRQAMKSQSVSDVDDLDQPTYDDVPEEMSGPSPIVPLPEDDEFDGEEIYEECG